MGKTHVTAPVSHRLCGDAVSPTKREDQVRKSSEKNHLVFQSVWATSLKCRPWKLKRHSTLQLKRKRTLKRDYNNVRRMYVLFSTDRFTMVARERQE